MRTSILMLCLVLVLGMTWAGSALGQDTPPANDEAATDGSVSEDAAADPDSQVERNEIEEILEGDDEVFAGGGYSYDPGTRRDPFISPFKKRSLLPTGPRPEGKAGLLIEEISLSGIFETPEGVFAQVQGGAKDKSYLLQAGDQLYDGDVVDVSVTEVVFNQIDNSPTATKPFREVVRRLNEKK